ncbi:MAG: transcriptional regulator [Acinetobacter sp.]|nr:transcriptional regulator [Acinetobacter sp.]
MNKTQLIAIGQALYGTQWQSDLARALDIDSRRVRQWLNDERPIPEWLARELKILLQNKINQCQDLLNQPLV